MVAPAISLITPTRNRQFLFDLTERWMKPNLENYNGEVQWIVADDSIVPTSCSLGQQLVRPEKVEIAITGINSFFGNIKRGLAAVKHDYVVIIEDDDYRVSNYLNLIMGLFTSPEIGIVGEAAAKYYNIPTMSYYIHKNYKYCSWTQTAFRSCYIPIVLDCVDHCRNYLLDMKVWNTFEEQGIKSNVQLDTTWCVGIKGLTQRAALGAGHNKTMYRLHDPIGVILREWVGDEVASVYLDLLIGRSKAVTQATPTIRRTRWQSRL